MDVNGRGKTSVTIADHDFSMIYHTYFAPCEIQVANKFESTPPHQGNDFWEIQKYNHLLKQGSFFYYLFS